MGKILGIVVLCILLITIGVLGYQVGSLGSRVAQLEDMQFGVNLEDVFIVGITEGGDLYMSGPYMRAGKVITFSWEDLRGWLYGDN